MVEGLTYIEDSVPMSSGCSSSLFSSLRRARQRRLPPRGGAVAARRAHNPKVRGSNPFPATKYQKEPSNRRAPFSCVQARTCRFAEPGASSRREAPRGPSFHTPSGLASSPARPRTGVARRSFGKFHDAAGSPLGGGEAGLRGTGSAGPAYCGPPGWESGFSPQSASCCRLPGRRHAAGACHGRRPAETAIRTAARFGLRIRHGIDAGPTRASSAFERIRLARHNAAVAAVLRESWG